MRGPLRTTHVSAYSEPYFQVASPLSYLFVYYPLQNDTYHRRNCQTGLNVMKFEESMYYINVKKLFVFFCN